MRSQLDELKKEKKSAWRLKMHACRRIMLPCKLSLNEFRKREKLLGKLPMAEVEILLEEQRQLREDLQAELAEAVDRSTDWKICVAVWKISSSKSLKNRR
jgi:sugar-specific transcriptional regulator TrmB